MAVMSLGLTVLIGLLVGQRWLGEPTRGNAGEFAGIKNSLKTHRSFAQVSGLLAGACLISLIVAWIDPVQFAGSGPQVHWLKDPLKLGYFLLPFFLASLWSSIEEPQVLLILRNWLVFSAAIAGIGMVQFCTGWPRLQSIPELPGHYHATLFFGHHLSTASILIFPFFTSLSLAFSRTTPKSLGLKSTTLALIAGCLGITLFLTWSRTLWIALPVGLGLWIVRYLRKNQAVVTLGLTVPVLIGLSRLPIIANRLFHTIGTTTRFQLWKANLAFFEHRPWTGIGWRKPESLTASYFQEAYGPQGKNEFVGHAHNNFLEMLGGTGLLGTAAWLLWSFWVFKMSWQLSRRKDHWGNIGWGIFCAWTVFQINGLTQVNFWEGKVLHQVMWTVSLLLFCSADRLSETRTREIA
jgi:O-antigen ligase